MNHRSIGFGILVWTIVIQHDFCHAYGRERQVPFPSDSWVHGTRSRLSRHIVHASGLCHRFAERRRSFTSQVGDWMTKDCNLLVFFPYRGGVFTPAVALGRTTLIDYLNREGIKLVQKWFCRLAQGSYSCEACIYDLRRFFSMIIFDKQRHHLSISCISWDLCYRRDSIVNDHSFTAKWSRFLQENAFHLSTISCRRAVECVEWTLKEGNERWCLCWDSDLPNNAGRT